MNAACPDCNNVFEEIISNERANCCNPFCKGRIGDCSYGIIQTHIEYTSESGKWERRFKLAANPT